MDVDGWLEGEEEGYLCGQLGDDVTVRYDEWDVTP